MAEDIPLLFSAGIEISRVNIRPNVVNVLSALSQGTTPVVKQKIQFDFDVGKGIGKVTNDATKIAQDLQKTLSKTKLNPGAILNTKELDPAIVRLEQIPVVLQGIRAAIKAIQSNPLIVPNAAQEVGKLGQLGRTLKELKREAEKEVKFQISAELQPIRDLDAPIKTAAKAVSIITSNLEKLASARGTAQSRLTSSTESIAGAQRSVREVNQARKSVRKASPDEIAALKAQQQDAKLKLDSAEKALAGSKTFAQQIDELTKSQKAQAAAENKALIQLNAFKNKKASEELKGAESREALVANALQDSRKRAVTTVETQALQAPDAVKILKPKEEKLAGIQSGIDATRSQLDAVNKEIQKVLDSKIVAAKKFLEDKDSPFVIAKEKIQAQLKGIKNVKQRNELKAVLESELQNQFGDQITDAQNALSGKAISPTLDKLKAKQTTLSGELSTRQASASQLSSDIENIKSEIKERARLNALSVDGKKAAEDLGKANKDLTKIQKAQADSLSPLEEKLKGAKSSLENTRKVIADLEKARETQATSAPKDKPADFSKEISDLKAKESAEAKVVQTINEEISVREKLASVRKVELDAAIRKEALAKSEVDRLTKAASAKPSQANAADSGITSQISDIEKQLAERRKKIFALDDVVRSESSQQLKAASDFLDPLNKESPINKRREQLRAELIGPNEKPRNIKLIEKQINSRVNDEFLNQILQAESVKSGFGKPTEKSLSAQKERDQLLLAERRDAETLAALKKQAGVKTATATTIDNSAIKKAEEDLLKASQEVLAVQKKQDEEAADLAKRFKAASTELENIRTKLVEVEQAQKKANEASKTQKPSVDFSNQIAEFKKAEAAQLREVEKTQSEIDKRRGGFAEDPALLAAQAKQAEARSRLESEFGKIRTKETDQAQAELEKASKTLQGLRDKEAVELAKLQKNYDDIRTTVSKTAKELERLEKLRSSGRTGLENKEQAVSDARQNLASVDQRLAFSGEKPEQTKQVQEALKTFRVAIAEKNQAAKELAAIDTQIANLEANLLVQQKTQNDLEKEQARLISEAGTGLQRNLDLRRKISKVIESNVEQEAKLQRNTQKILGKAGISYTPQDPRESALKRLGVTESDLENPNQQLLDRLKEARPSRSRSEDLYKAVEQATRQDQDRIVQQRLDRLLKRSEEVSATRRRASGTAAPSTAAGVATLAAEREAESREVIKSVLGGIPAARSEVSNIIKSLPQADVVTTIRRIDEEYQRQTEELKKQKALEDEVNQRRKARLDIEKAIRREIREEARSRQKIAETLTPTGVSYDVNTGLARRNDGGVAGAPFAVGQSGNLREVALRRLGVSEFDVASGGADVRDRIKRAQEGIAAERQREYEGIRDARKREQAESETISRLRRLVEREILLERRRAATSGRTAEGVGQISSRVISGIFGPASAGGPAVGSFAGARSALGGLDEGAAVALRDRLTAAIERQNVATREQARLEADLERRSRERADRERQRLRDEEAARQRQARALERVNRLIQQTSELIERQIRTTNNLARTGIRDAAGNTITQIQATQQQIRDRATRLVTGVADPSTLSTAQLETVNREGQGRLRDQRAVLRQYNDDVKAVTRGAISGFELTAKYGEDAFTRIGGRVGLATERLSAYVFGATGLYSLIAATRLAVVETALLEKEITNIEQIFSTSSSFGESVKETSDILKAANADADNFGSNLSSAFSSSGDVAKSSASAIKNLILDLSEVTGTSAIEIAQAAKTLAAAGFGQGKAGFEETIRSVSLATLGPSFGNSQEVIDGLIASINQFNRSLTETPYILGLVNEFSKAYAVESQDLFEAIKRGGGAFSAVGGSLEDFLKLVTIARERTREAAPVIGTFLKTLSSRLFAPRTDTLLKQLGLDPEALIDPYERLLGIARAISQQGGGNASVITKVLTELVDARQTGRLSALLESLVEFQNKAEDLTIGASTSIVDDARRRLNDIGPTLDRIRASFFRLVEGIYNNPATKALLSVPAGLLQLLSKAPSVGGGGFTAANFINPLIQSSVLVGLTGVIRGAYRALQQNYTGLRLNTDSLNTLRTSIDGLRTSLAPAAAATALGAAGAAGAAGGISALPDRRRGLFSGLSLFSSAGLNPAIGIAAATIVPGVVNSLLQSLGPQAGVSQESAGVISSGVLGAGQGFLLSSLFTRDPRLLALSTILGGGLAAGGAAQEQKAIDEQLRLERRQSENARRAVGLQRLTATGSIDEAQNSSGQVEVVFQARSAEIFAKVLAGRQQEENRIRARLIREAGASQTQAPATLEQTASSNIQFAIGTSGYTAKDFTDDLLNISKNAERNQRERREALGITFNKDEKSVVDAEKSFKDTQKQLREAIFKAFVTEFNLDGLEDNLKNRQETIKKVSKDLAESLNIEGLVFTPDQIEEVLSETYLDTVQATGDFSKGVTGLKFAIRSLYDEAEVAGRIISSFGAALGNAIQTQTIGVQRLVDESRRLNPSIDATTGIIRSPFRASSIQQLPQIATAETAASTIERITGRRPNRISDEATRSFARILDGFFREFDQASETESDSRGRLIRALTDNEKLRAIGGNFREDQDTEARGAQASPINREVFIAELSELLSPLKDFGTESSKLFDIIVSNAAVGGVPFDIRELGKALTNRDVNSAEKILGLDRARIETINLANALIEQQNYSLQQTAQISEAIVASVIDRQKAELELKKITATTEATLLNISANLGVLPRRQATEAAISAERTAIEVIPDRATINANTETINLIKQLQLTLNREISSTGAPQRDRSNLILSGSNLLDPVEVSIGAQIQGLLRSGQLQESSLAQLQTDIRNRGRDVVARTRIEDESSFARFDNLSRQLEQTGLQFEPSQLLDVIEGIRDAGDRVSINRQGGTFSVLDTAQIQDQINKIIQASARVIPGIQTNDATKLSGVLQRERALLENSIQFFLERSREAFTQLSKEIENSINNIQLKRGILEGSISRLFTGNPGDRVTTENRFTRASQNITDLVRGIQQAVPNFAQLGPTDILNNQVIGNIVRDRLSILGDIGISEIRDLTALVGAEQFTATGASGEQVRAAIEAAFAPYIAQITGAAVGPTQIQTEVDRANQLLKDARDVSAKTIDLQKSLSQISEQNLSLLNTEVDALTKAISAIPKEINIVVRGIDRVSVDFNVQKIDESVKNIGDAVFNRITGYFREAFRRNNIPISDL